VIHFVKFTQGIQTWSSVYPCAQVKLFVGNFGAVGVDVQGVTWLNHLSVFCADKIPACLSHHAFAISDFVKSRSFVLFSSSSVHDL
jgi:hypothetical protein